MLTTLLKHFVFTAAGAVAVALVNALFERYKGKNPEWRSTVIALVGGAVLGFTFATLTGAGGDDRPTKTIYSSLPAQDPGGARSKRTGDMEKAIRLALKDADGKAGDYNIEYKPLNSADDTGLITPERVQANARRAADDDATAAYIGDFTSGASIESIPILSKAKVPQISPTSTRVGLTVEDEFVDVDEPERYYPNGYRNFVRIIPNDDVQAAALNSLMKRDRCKKVAIIYDGSDYSQGLAVLMALFISPKRVFSEDVRPKEGARRYTELAKKASVRGADCFQYLGDNNSNTFAIFEEFARALPGARLYGSDGVSQASLTDPDGNLAGFASQVRLMVPPRDLDQQSGFRQSFLNEYPEATAAPDPYAIYAYEAMKLALDAIEGSGDAAREAIVEQLHAVERRTSMLGIYSIDRGGDTDLVDYDVLRFSDGTPRTKSAVPAKDLKRALLTLSGRK